MSGKIPDNYEKVDDRIKNFRRDYPGAKGKIETIPQHTQAAIMWEARIFVRRIEKETFDPAGKLLFTECGEFEMIANGHAYDKWGPASQYEKTEKAAIGRALVMAGYASLSEPSAEEMELDAQRPRTGNGPGTTAQAPTTSGTRPSGVIPPKGRNNAPNAPTVTPQAGAATVDRAKFRPAYVAVIKKAEDLVEQGKTEDELKAYFVGRKKGMNAEEYQDSLAQFGRLKAAIVARDAALVAEADAEIDAEIAAEF